MEEKKEISGPELETEVMDIGIGQWIFKTFTEKAPEALIMSEADTERDVSFGEVLKLSTGLATGLRAMGVRPKDVVALVGDNSVDFCVAAFGVTMMGGIMCPIDPTLKAYEYQHLLSLVDPVVIIAEGSIASVLRHAMQATGCAAVLIAVGAVEEGATMRYENLFQDKPVDTFEPYICQDPKNETLCLVCSSGTTGLPKAVMLTHFGLAFQTAAAAGQRTFAMGPILQSSFFYWISGVLMLYGFACAGAYRVLLRTADPGKVLKAIQQYKILACVFSPTLLTALVQHPQITEYNTSSLRVVNCGGSVLLKSTVEKLKEAIPGCIVVQTYGLTELSGVVSKSMPPLDVFTLGMPFPCTTIKVVDVASGEALGPDHEGEIVVKSPSVMKGYYRDPAATRAAIDDDGWLHTGDMGKWTAGDILHLTGRVKELLKVDNHQISPAEIEFLIGALPGVLEVAVAGIAVDENLLPMALVVRNPDVPISEEDIIQIVNDNLSEFKQLRAGVQFVDHIPRTSSGKLKRQEIQLMAESLYTN